MSKLKGIAWDLFHIRTSEDQIALRNTNSKEVFTFNFTADKGLSNVINNYSISRMLAHEEKLYVYRDNNIFKNYQKDKATKIQELLEKIEI